MALIVLKFMYPNYWEEVNLCCEYGLGELLPLEIYINFKTYKLIAISLSNIVISIHRRVKNHSHIKLGLP